jgi:hypothetical protein
MGISLIGPMPTADTGNIMDEADRSDTGNIMNQSAGVAPNQSAPRAPTPVIAPGKDYSQQGVAEGIRRGMIAPPPPPPPRSFREAEQQRIDEQRNGVQSPFGNLGDIMGDQGNVLDLGTAESRKKAMESALNKPPMTDAELGDFNAATERAGEKTVLTGGANPNQLIAHMYNSDSGGYQFMTRTEYDALLKNRPKGNLQMQDIAGKDNSGRDGMYVFMAGNTGLSLDNYNASQSEVWAQMSPQERRDYLGAQASMHTLRADAPQRLDIALKANDIAVSAQHRYLVDAMKKGVKPKDIKGGFFSNDAFSYKAASSVEWDQVPSFIVWQEQMPDGKLGFKSIKSLSEVYESVLNDVETDRHMAGELAIAMLNANMLGGATAAYAGDFIGHDSNGKPVAQWNPADWNDNLRMLVQEVAKRQKAGAVPGASMDSFWQVVKNTAAYNQQTATGATSYPGSGGGSKSGGGGYSRYSGGGGGGGGYVQREFQSDATMLAAQLDSITRARLGRSATQEERDAFIAQFHGLESQYSAAYNQGGVATQPDPQGQAVAWVEQHASAEQASQTSGEFITALADFIRGPGLHKGA